MYRIYKTTVEHFLVMAVWFRYLSGRNLRAIYEEVFDWIQRNPDQLPAKLKEKVEMFIHLALRHGKLTSPIEGTIIDSTILGFAEQLDGHRPRELDLIDRLVTTLNLPYGANGFSAEVVRNLAQALLTPSELDTLMADFGKRMYCGHCGTPIVKGEAVTITDGTNNYGKKFGLTLACRRCVKPTCIAADCCDQKVPLTRRLINALDQPVICDKHKEKPPAPQEPAMVIDQAPPDPVDPNGIHATMRQWFTVDQRANTQNFAIPRPQDMVDLQAQLRRELDNVAQAGRGGEVPRNLRAAARQIRRADEMPLEVWQEFDPPMLGDTE